METCGRCTNHLALGLSIVKVEGITQVHEIKLCGSCTDELINHWMQVYATSKRFREMRKERKNQT